MDKINFPIDVPKALHVRFKAACQRSGTSMAKEMREFIVKRIDELKRLPIPQNSPSEKDVPERSVISAQVPLSLRDDFHELSKAHGLRMSDQMLEFFESRTAEIERETAHSDPSVSLD